MRQLAGEDGGVRMLALVVANNRSARSIRSFGSVASRSLNDSELA